MERSSHFNKDQRHGEELVCSGGDAACRESTHRRLLSPYSCAATGCAGPSSVVEDGRHREKENNEDDGAHSPPSIKASRADDAATICRKMKVDEAVRQGDPVKASGNSQHAVGDRPRATHRADVSKNSGPEQSVKEVSVSFDDRCPQQTARVKASAQVHVLVPLGVLSGSGGVAANVVAATEREIDASADSDRKTHSACFLAAETAPASCAVGVSERPEAAAENAPMDSLSSYTTSASFAKDVLEDASSSEVSALSCTSQHLRRECNAHGHQTLGQPQHPPEKSATDIATQDAGESKARVLKEGHDVQSHQETHYERQCANPGEKGSKECRVADSLSADDKVKGKKEHRITRHPVVALCRAGKEPLLAPKDTPQVAQVDSGDGGSQLCREEAEAFYGCDVPADLPLEHLEQPQRGALERASVGCRTVHETNFSQNNADDISEDISTRLPELRQFTLELLYAVSLLRPFGKKGCSDRDQSGLLRWHAVPAVDQREGVTALSSALLVRHSGCFLEQHEEGQMNETRASEKEPPETSRFDRATSDHQLAALIPARVRLRQSQDCSDGDYVAALHRCVTDGVMLCTGEETSGDVSTTGVLGLKGNRGGFEEDVRELCREFGSEADDAADAAVATVASAGARPHKNSFEAFAQKIAAVNTTKELVVLLHGYFGPLLHLLQQHMSRNTLQHLNKSAAGTRIKRMGKVVSSHFGVFKGAAHTLAERPHSSSPQLQQQVLHASQIDQTVKGVNAILQVLTETDQSAADTTLDSVCERLFPSRCDVEEFPPSEVYSPAISSEMSRATEFTTQAGEDRNQWHSNQQQTFERIPPTRPLPRRADDIENLHSGRAARGRSFSQADLLEEKTERQFRFREEEREVVSGKGVRTSDFLPRSPITERTVYPSTEEQQEDSKTRNNACVLTKVGDQAQVTDSGTTISERRACREGPTDCYTSRVSAGEEFSDTAASVSEGASLSVTVRLGHGIEKKDTAESLVGAGERHEAERNPLHVAQYSLQRQQHPQASLPCRGDMEERGRSRGRSSERGEPLSSRTAWLAAQLSTPLDFLGGNCAGEVVGTKNEEVSEEAAHILETLEAAVFQPSEPHVAGSRAASPTEEQIVEAPRGPHALETGVQLVLQMLREQEEQWPLSEAAEASSEDRCPSVSERTPKRRALLDESEAGVAASRRVLTEQKQLHSSVWDTNRDGSKAHECIAGAFPHVVSSAAETVTVTGERAAEERSLSSTNPPEAATAAAGHTAASGKIAAAAAVERAAAAVAQQGVAAAVEQARVGSEELMRRIRDLGCSPAAELSGPTPPLTTELAASSCHALRRAVEYVGPSTNDKNEEQQVGEDSKDIFAELDNEGLDSLVSQLLKLAGRPTEQRRGQNVYGEQLLSLLRDLQGDRYPESAQVQQADLLRGSSSHLSRHQQGEPYQQHPQQHAQWEAMTAEDAIVRRGDSGDGTLLSQYSVPQRKTDSQSTCPVTLEKTHVSSGAGYSDESHTTFVSSSLRGASVLQREETVLPACASPAPEKRTGVSSVATWPRRPLSSRSPRLVLDPVGSTDNAFLSPFDSPYTSRHGRHSPGTTALSISRSCGPSLRQGSMKRSPWRACEPYSGSASTVATSPLASSAQSFGSSSLVSSPFSLLPTSAATAFQPTGAAPELRSEEAGEASTSVGSGGPKLARGARLGLIEDSAQEGRRPQKSSRWNEERQRRCCLEGMLHPSDLLPPRVSGADFVSTSSGPTALREASGEKALSGEDATGMEVECHSNVVVGSLYTHLHESDFFDVSPSARAHILRQAATSREPVTRALSALAPVVPTAVEGGGGSGRKQEQGISGGGQVQATATAKHVGVSMELFTTKGVQTSGSPNEKAHGGPKRAASRKCEAARLLSSCVSSSSSERYLSDSGPFTMPFTGQQSFSSTSSSFGEARRLNADAGPPSADEEPSSHIDQQRVETDTLTRAARPTSEAPTTTVTSVRANQEQHHLDVVTRVAVSQSWAHDAGSNGRPGRQQQQQQQRSFSDGNDFWRKDGGATDRGLLRARSTGAGRQEETDGSRYRTSSLLQPPAFTRSTLPGVRREAATAGCVGTGGADCLCGGALCLYRSAVSGVVYDKSGQKWTARWNEDGRQHKRTFAAAKYGFLTAKLKAETCRGEARERTARAKQEALQQQQESLAHRVGLFRVASSADDSSHSHRGAVAGSSATAVAAGALEQKQVRP